MRRQYQPSRIAGYHFAIRKHAQFFAAFNAITTKAIFGETNSPYIKKLAKSEILHFVGLDMNYTGSIVGVERGYEPFLIINSDIFWHRYRLSIDEGVNVLMNVQRAALLVQCRKVDGFRRVRRFGISASQGASPVCRPGRALPAVVFSADLLSPANARYDNAMPKVSVIPILFIKFLVS